MSMPMASWLSADRSRRAVSASLLGIVQRLVQLASTLITLPLLLRELGIADFGVWGVMTSLVWLSTVADLGLGGALLSKIPKLLAAGDTSAARGLVTTALAVSGLLMAVGLIIGLALPALAISQELKPLTGIAICALAANIPLSLANCLWFSVQRGTSASAWELAQTVLTTLSLVIAMKLHCGLLVAVTIPYTCMLLTCLASLIHFFYRVPALRPDTLTVSWSAVLELSRSGGSLFAVTIAVASNYVLDGIVALSWGGSRAAAQVTVALRVCTTVSGLVNVATQPLWPAFVQALAAGDRSWALKSLRWGTLLTAVATLTGAVILVWFGESILTKWLKSDVASSPDLMFASAAWIIAWSIPRVSGLLLNAALILRPQLILFTATAVLSLVLKILLAPAFGAAGVIASTPICWVMLVWPTVYLVVRSRFRLGDLRPAAVMPGMHT